MVVDTKLVNNKLTARFRGIENQVLRNMEPDQLVAELERVESDLYRLNGILKGQPRWMTSVPEVRRERNCLQSEKRRIERELDARAMLLRHAAFDRIADRDESADRMADDPLPDRFVEVTVPDGKRVLEDSARTSSRRVAIWAL